MSTDGLKTSSTTLSGIKIISAVSKISLNQHVQRTQSDVNYICLYLTNKKASTVPCSVIKHAGSGASTKEVQGETRADRQVFLSTS